MQESLTLFDLIPGTLLADRFKILRSHRQGGLSTAYVVHDAERDRECELQLFPPALFESAEEARDFTASWDAWKTIEHPSITPVLDVVKIGNGNLALLTGMPGDRSLRDLLTEGRSFSEAEVRRLGTELCAGLAALHRNGLVHGDVKPNTIFISEGGDGGFAPRLVDGGVTGGLWAAKHLGENTALIGTPYYAPVEQFGGTAPDARSDVYNLATVLFELATGVLPWRGKSFLEVFQSKLEPKAPKMRVRAPEAKVSAGFEEAIALGLIADRNERYADAAQMGAVLSELGPLA